MIVLLCFVSAGACSLMKTFTTPLSTKYPIYIAPDILDTTFFDLSILAHDGDIVIISDELVTDLYVRKIVTRLLVHRKVYVIEIAGGEVNKNRENKRLIEDKIINLGLAADIMIVAIGGGVVLDLAGFVAATFCNGVPCVYIPTTLVAMVATSISNRVGVHTPLGRNTVGVAMEPRSVWIDVAVLESVGCDDLCDGMIYMLRLALLADRDFFARLSLLSDALGNIATEVWVDLLAHSLKLKIDLLARENSVGEKLLTFGSVIGDALLSCSSYQASSGQSLQFGMLVESRMSSAMGLLPAASLIYINDCLNAIKYENPFSYHGLRADQLMSALHFSDSIATNKRIVLLKDVAAAHIEYGEILYPLDKELLRKCLTQFLPHNRVC
jgi:3-dehydroquinate synthase